MGHSSRTAAILLCALLVVPLATECQTPPSGRGLLPAAGTAAGSAIAETVEPPLPTTKAASPRLESRLQQLYEAYLDGDHERLAALAGQSNVDLAKGKVRVILDMDVDPEAQPAGPAVVETVMLADGRSVQVEKAPPVAIRSDLAQAIAAAGAAYETAYGSWVQVLAPIGSLEALGQIPGVRLVRLPFPAAPAVLSPGSRRAGPGRARAPRPVRGPCPGPATRGSRPSGPRQEPGPLPFLLSGPPRPCGRTGSSERGRGLLAAQRANRTRQPPRRVFRPAKALDTSTLSHQCLFQRRRP